MSLAEVLKPIPKAPRALRRSDAEASDRKPQRLYLSEHIVEEFGTLVEPSGVSVSRALEEIMRVYIEESKRLTP